MILTPKVKYQIKELDLTFNLTLISLPNRNNTHYKWQHDDGKFTENRQVDIDRWVKWKIISKI